MDALPKKLARVNINGRDYELPEGVYLTEAARLVGIEIPQFCAYRWLEPLGACRMCLVRVDKIPKLQIACALPVSDGLTVITESEEIQRAREEMLEFHLLNHPLECPVCDRGGECPLQDLTERYGKYKSRYIEEKLVRADTNLNSFLRMNYKRCILCKRCVRYCDEVAGDHLIEFEDRGGWTRVTTFLGTDSPNRFSGNIIELCPVGAITSIPFRFRGRAWELEKRRTVCDQCSVGCNLELHTRLGALQRIVPAVHQELDDGHICDRGRFAYGWINSPKRLRKPLIKVNGSFEEVSWNHAEVLCADKIKSAIQGYGADSVAIVAGNTLTSEEYFALSKFATDFIGTANFSILEDMVDVPSSSQLLREILVNLGSITDIIESELILLMGTDILEEAPILGLRVEEAVRRYGAKLASLSSYRHDSERKASIRAYYEPGKFLAGISALRSELDSNGETLKYPELVSQLRSASTISVIFGQDVLFGAKAGRNAQVVYTFASALREVRERDGGPLTRLTVTPIFTGANSMGAILAGSAISGETARTSSFNQVLEKCEEGKIKVLLLLGVNPLVSFPDARFARLAIEKADFVVAQDIFLTETSSLADVILPVCPFIFKDGTFLNFEGRLQRVRSVPVVDEAPSDLEVLNRLLIAMGKGSHFLTAEDVFQNFSKFFVQLAGVQLADIPSEGTVIRFDGRLAKKDKTSIDVPETDLPNGYSLVLIPKRYLFRNSPKLEYTHWMKAITPGEWVLINESDAKSLDIADREEVLLESPHGSLTLTAKYSRYVPTGAVIVDTRIKGKGLNTLISRDDEIFPVRIVKR